jgi:hypothetical protein
MAGTECRECGKQVATDSLVCPQCGSSQAATQPTELGSGEDQGAPRAFQLPSGNDAAALKQLGRWNWGAFFLPCIWAFAHRLTLLGVVGLLLLLLWGLRVSGIVPSQLYRLEVGTGMVLPVYLGVRGNQLAWRRRPFRDVQHFRQVQRAWRNWGIGLCVVQFGVLFLWFVLRAASGAGPLTPPVEPLP